MSRSIPAAAYEGKRDSADRGDCHEEVFIENAAVQYALTGLAQNIIADDDVRRKVQEHCRYLREAHKIQQRQQHRGDDYAHKHLFLLFIHINLPYVYKIRPSLGRAFRSKQDQR